MALPSSPVPQSGPDTEPPRAAGARLLTGGLLVATVAGVGLAAAVARSGDILDARWRVLVLLGVWSAAWALGVVCALRVPVRVALPVVLVAAVAIRLAALSGPPTLSDDLYRYSWDGRVQAAGTSPYRYPPDSPALAQLREPWLWPDAAGCAEIHRPPGCSRMNRIGVRTIYPPVAQAWFAGAYRVAGIEARHKTWQVAGVLTESAVVLLLPLVLAAWGRDRRWTALYALSPLAVVEVVNNGHVEGLAVVLIVLALLAAAHRRAGWAGALVGGATLIKLYPALLLVGLGGGEERRRSALVRATAGALAVVGVGYLFHVLTVGPRVLGFLPGYLREEQYDDGGRYLLAGLLGLPAPVTVTLAAAGVLAVVGWVTWRRPPAPDAFAALLGAALLAVTPVQPWYAVTLLAVATVAARPRWALVASAAYPFYFCVILGVPHAVAVGRLSYGVALAGVVALSLAGRQRRIISGCSL